MFIIPVLFSIWKKKILFCLSYCHSFTVNFTLWWLCKSKFYLFVRSSRTTKHNGHEFGFPVPCTFSRWDVCSILVLQIIPQILQTNSFSSVASSSWINLLRNPRLTGRFFDFLVLICFSGYSEEFSAPSSPRSLFNLLDPPSSESHSGSFLMLFPSKYDSSSSSFYIKKFKIHFNRLQYLASSNHVN